MQKLLINEIFASIQGEGKSIGKPVLFIRSYGCNSHCNFCDSKYSWEKSKEKFEMTIPEVLAEVEKYPRIKRWVITGGEPMLQQKGFVSLLKAFHKKHNRLPIIEWETNGTIKPTIATFYVTTQFNVSPKFSRAFSKPRAKTESERIKPRVINWYKDSEVAYFKFVIGDEQDILELLEFQDKYHISNEKIYLMPLGKTRKELNIFSKKLIKFCLINNYNFSPRLHIMLFNNKRKV